VIQASVLCGIAPPAGDRLRGGQAGLAAVAGRAHDHIAPTGEPQLADIGAAALQQHTAAIGDRVRHRKDVVRVQRCVEQEHEQEGTELVGHGRGRSG